MCKNTLWQNTSWVNFLHVNGTLDLEILNIVFSLLFLHACNKFQESDNDKSYPEIFLQLTCRKQQGSKYIFWPVLYDKQHIGLVRINWHIEAFTTQF